MSKGNKLSPLTEQEKRIAENNHDIVYAFLHGNKLSIEEYYNVVIFGYLKAVQDYHRNDSLRKKYTLGCLAWLYMSSEVMDYFKMENAKKRKPEHGTVSIDDEQTENILHDRSGKSAEESVMEKELIKCISENLSDIQRKIVGMKSDGYTPKEIFLILEMPSSSYYKEMERIRAVVENILID